MNTIQKSVISHSEVDSFLACERRHYYAFGYPVEGHNGLEPKVLSNGLFRGIMGHEVMEHYYKELQSLESNQGSGASNYEMVEAANNALGILPAYIVANPEKMEMILDLRTVCDAYFKYYRDEDKMFQFLSVEEEFRNFVNAGIDFPFKPDLIRRHRATGKVEVVDHKFLANLYTPQEIAIQPQMPKYVGALRELGYKVDDAVYDLICHRVLKTKPYVPAEKLKRTKLNLTNTRIQHSQDEQNSVVENIAIYKALPIRQWEAATRRTATSYNCKNCSFLDICISELNGENVDVAVKYNFSPNTYGYDKENK